MVPVVFIAGYSDTGKTTLVKNLVKAFKQMGYTLAVIKHAPHGYDLDVQKSDTWYFCQAKADQVIAVGPSSLISRRLYTQEPTLKEIYQMVDDVDLILIEGFKNEPGPKIEVVRGSKKRLSLEDELIALVSDDPLSEGVPCFPTTAVTQLAEFLIGYLSLKE